jgi:anti-sigma factor RsiW
MARLDMITEADLLDYVEGRLPLDDRKKIAGRLADEPALAEKCERVRRQTLGVHSLRAVLAVEGVPQEWLDLLNRRKPH